MHDPASPPRRRGRRLLPTLALAALSACTTVSLDEPPAARAPVAAATAPASAPEDASPEQRFARWMAALRESARAAGIDDATLHAALDDVHYLPRMIDQDRAQPEFVRTPWDYIDRAVTPRRVTQGRDELAQLHPQADAVSARYGVPPNVVIAIWGMESDYGGDFGDVPTIDALATLGFEGRREDWARKELLAALRILQNGDITRERMVGSWAGAMGQTQFLPSTYLGYAVDADGDGRRDIWGSMADVLASTANFLARSGWRADEPWGIEVRLPAGFDVGRADSTVRQAAAQWAAEGVQSADGTPLANIADAAILLPAGARGPAFLTGANFRAILRYNNSSSYALAVGLLAQGLAGGPGVQAPWPRDLAALTRSQLQSLQAALAQRGFPCGTPDGVMGPATRDALRRYQRGIGVPADGYPTLELLQRLQAP